MTKNYTKEKIHKICKLIEGGYNNKDIASLIGEEYNKNFIIFIYRIKNGLNWKKISKNYNMEVETKRESEIREICELLEKGLDSKQISEKMDKGDDVEFRAYISQIKTGRVWRKISEEYNFIKNKKEPSNYHSEKEIHKICKLIEDGYNNKDIASLTGEEYNKNFIMLLYRIRNDKIWTHISKNYNMNAELKRETEIRKICELIERRLDVNEIAKMLGKKCDASFKSNVSLIRTGKIWTHISKDYNFKSNLSKRELEVHEICRLIKEGCTSKEIALLLNKEYNTSFINSISQIKIGRTWANISKEYNIVKK